MSRKETTRITVEIPKTDHRRVKMFAAAEGKSMKTIFIEILEKGLENYSESLKSTEPSEVTKKIVKKKKKQEFLDKIPAREAWLFKPENKEILKAVQEGLRKESTVDRGSFLKYLKK
jgi:hypothetical protein